MKVKIERVTRNTYTVVISQGVQSFHLALYDYTKSEAEWFAKMFKKALKAHNKEIKSLTPS